MITSVHAAMAKKREDIENDEQGFTLIELLVVILIIGILAAIAIPVFLGQQNQAKDGAAKSDLGNAKIAMVSAATADNGVYPSPDAAGLAKLTDYGYSNSITGTGSPVSIVSSNGTGTFCLQATSDAGTDFNIKQTGGVTAGAC